MNDLHLPTLAGVRDTWKPRLRKRTGGRTLLLGLDVYYDFRWRAVMSHGRTAFRYGKDLARRIRRDCPDGMTPILLLTTKDDVEEGVLETSDSNNIFVVRILEYLEKADAGAAGNYFGRNIQANTLTAMGRATRKLPDSLNVASFMDRYANEATLTEWVRRKAGRMKVLQRIAAPSIATAGVKEDSPVSFSTKRFIQDANQEEIEEIVDGLVDTVNGRDAILRADLIPHRIDAARKKVREYSDLLSSPDSSETDLQTFIAKNPSLLGLEYRDVISEKSILRCKVDFLVQRYDGYHDLVELKGPQDSIIRFREGDEARASSYSLSPTLANALAQVHLYREVLARATKEILKDTYSIEHARDPRVTIVIGQASKLPNKTAKKILHQLNLTLHRMEVVPYDWLAKRAETQWKNATMFT